nr:MAG TPA: hypothetical protein [Caudoviricetes sp.]
MLKTSFLSLLELQVANLYAATRQVSNLCWV